MRLLRFLHLGPAVVCVSLAAACSGGGSSLAPPLASDHTAVLPNDLARSNEISGTSSSGEQLFVLVSAGGQSIVSRYNFGSTTPVATMQVANSQTALAVSAQNQYVITTDGFVANVYGPQATHTTITLPETFSGSIMSMSTDDRVLGFVAVNPFTLGPEVVEYRAPFTTLYQSANGQGQNGTGIQLINENGSLAVGINGGSLGGEAQSLSVPAGNDGVIFPPLTSIPTTGFEAFDGHHSWLYAYAQRQLSSPVNLLQIYDFAHDKYLGYINLPVDGVAALSVNQATGELYAAFGGKIYVYNVPLCRCTIPRRIFKAALSGAQIVIDAQNEHLLVYQPASQEIVDQNPQTGAVQQTYHVSTAAGAQIYGVVAQ